MGMGTRDRTRRDRQGATVRSAPPGLLSGEAPPRRMTVKSVCLAGTLPTAWSWAIRTTAARLKAPLGPCYYWVMVFLPTPALGFSQRSTQASLGPEGPPSHSQHRKSTLGEGRSPRSCSEGLQLPSQGPWSLCVHVQEQEKLVPEPQRLLGHGLILTTTWSQCLGLPATHQVHEAQISRASHDAPPRAWCPR